MDPDRSDPRAAQLAAFTALVGTGRSEVPLDETALAMSAVLQPDLELIEWLAALDEIAASCPTPTRQGVVQHVCEDLGFAGDRSTYASWRNSCLDQVIQTRRGIPITMSILVVEVARRVGVELVGIGMPAHFLVGDPNDPEWFADPFDGGRILDRRGCRDLLNRLTHGQVPWDDSHLSPTSNRLIIARMTNNLKSGFAQHADYVRLALVMRMRMAMREFSSELHEAVRAQAVLN